MLVVGPARSPFDGDGPALTHKAKIDRQSARWPPGKRTLHSTEDTVHNRSASVEPFNVEESLCIVALTLEDGPTRNSECLSAMPGFGGGSGGALPPGSDLGFAKQALRLVSVASFHSSYPNICPYPLMAMLHSTSAEELPALVKDKSDAEDGKDDEDNNVKAPALASMKVTGSVDKATTAAGLKALVSRPLLPVMTDLAQIQLQAHLDGAQLLELLSLDSSRPTLPVLTALSKGNQDGSWSPSAI
ncbi:hypothetical protein BCV70DRAFT_215914 [Testicularia cyperi]|uniref:Uncharacterized protein n=1 Tax=Testicularia cyperi TaxID=1882483 RepID=A0A317XUA6_9BASI|nr:hypothetical protein BCV70DRAFT_215914 [Testicularia cyperi]